MTNQKKNIKGIIKKNKYGFFIILKLKILSRLFRDFIYLEKKESEI